MKLPPNFNKVAAGAPKYWRQPQKLDPREEKQATKDQWRSLLAINDAIGRFSSRRSRPRARPRTPWSSSSPTTATRYGAPPQSVQGLRLRGVRPPPAAVGPLARRHGPGRWRERGARRQHGHRADDRRDRGRIARPGSPTASRARPAASRRGELDRPAGHPAAPRPVPEGAHPASGACAPNAGPTSSTTARARSSSTTTTPTASAPQPRRERPDSRPRAGPRGEARPAPKRLDRSAVFADLLELDPAADLGEPAARARVDHRAGALADLDLAAEGGDEPHRRRRGSPRPRRSRPRARTHVGGPPPRGRPMPRGRSQPASLRGAVERVDLRRRPELAQLPRRAPLRVAERSR